MRGDHMQKYDTKQRRLLLGMLRAHADEAFSAARIAESFSGEGISLSAVYRNLSSLEKEGKIRRVTNRSGKAAYYMYSDAEECRDHLHVSCTRCGCTFHVDEKTTESIINNVKNCAGFEIDRQNTVIYGVCDKCKK